MRITWCCSKKSTPNRIKKRCTFSRIQNWHLPVQITFNSFFFSELLLKQVPSLSVCLSYVGTRTGSRLRRSSTASWSWKSSKLLSWHRKSPTATSSPHLGPGSTWFEQLRGTRASVQVTRVYKLPPCVGHTKPFQKI